MCGVGEKTGEKMSSEINELISEMARYKVAAEVFQQERDDVIQKSQKEISELKEELDELKRKHAATLWEYCDSVKKEDYENVKSENEKMMKQIAHDQAKIADLLNEIDSKRSEIMPDEPIRAADRLIHAIGIRETNAIQRTFGRSGRYETYDLYSISDLRQIAEYLLVYCNNNEADCKN